MSAFVDAQKASAPLVLTSPDDDLPTDASAPDRWDVKVAFPLELRAHIEAARGSMCKELLLSRVTLPDAIVRLVAKALGEPMALGADASLSLFGQVHDRIDALEQGGTRPKWLADLERTAGAIREELSKLRLAHADLFAGILTRLDVLEERLRGGAEAPPTPPTPPAPAAPSPAGAGGVSLSPVQRCVLPSDHIPDSVGVCQRCGITLTIVHACEHTVTSRAKVPGAPLLCRDCGVNLSALYPETPEQTAAREEATKAARARIASSPCACGHRLGLHDIRPGPSKCLSPKCGCVSFQLDNAEAFGPNGAAP